jgi:hypothetical protein
MSVSAKNLSLYGGSTASGPQGPYVELLSDTGQDINVVEQIMLKAGTADNLAFYGGSLNGGSVNIKSGDGYQNISAADHQGPCRRIRPRQQRRNTRPTATSRSPSMAAACSKSRAAAM